MRRIILSCLALLVIPLGLTHPAAAQNVTIDLTPITYPIVLPDSGGSFDYLLTVTNLGSSPITATVWCMVTLPNGTSWGPALCPATHTLSAGQTQTVQIPLSPTGGAQTVQIDETLVPGWVSTAAITCTSPTGGAAPYVTTDGANRRITAVLDATKFGAICTITNTKPARVTVVEQSAGGTGTFAFTSGTNGLPAGFTLDTGVSNPASAGPYVKTRTPASERGAGRSRIASVGAPLSRLRT